MSLRGEREFESETQEKEFLIRSKNYGIKSINTQLEDKKNIIQLLKKVLSKKYNLEPNDYIILIDKFKLGDKKITKESIEELISYLNTQEYFNVSPTTKDASPQYTLSNILKEPSLPDKRIVNYKNVDHVSSKSPQLIIVDLLNDLDLINFNGTYNISIKPFKQRPKQIILKKLFISDKLKREFTKDLYTFIKIREFSNNICVNSSQNYYFSYFTIENNKIDLMNTDIIVSKTQLYSNLNITFYDSKNNVIKILDTGESEFMTLFLEFKF
tara:strand:- start:480 stop:1289 length:810 start_codon:yes stop_codon:yes gene_type:complete